MNPKKAYLLPVIIAVLPMFVLLLTLPGCSESPPPKPSAPTTLPAASSAPHSFDPVKVARGGEIYKANCAVCHGTNAEGAPNWSQKGPDGKFPPPPLDASGHGWHHPKSALVQTVKEGTAKLGGGMPAWKGTLTDDDIEAVLSWIQSRWPEDVYKSWAFMDEKARRE